MGDKIFLGVTGGVHYTGRLRRKGKGAPKHKNALGPTAMLAEPTFAAWTKLCGRMTVCEGVIQVTAGGARAACLNALGIVAGAAGVFDAMMRTCTELEERM